jgi:hypothetical protein
MNYEFRSYNHPRHYIRQHDSLGELTRKDGPREEFAFRIVDRGGDLVSLGWGASRKLFLRHRKRRMRLEGPNGGVDEQFRGDSTFHMVEGLADPAGISFLSANTPGHYIRHRDFQLYLEPEDSENLAADATFFMEPSAVLFDPGVVLEEA